MEDSKQKNILIVIVLLILVGGAVYLSFQAKETEKEVVTIDDCTDVVNERYVRAASLYEPIREDHMGMFNVLTGIAKDTAAQIGECEAEGSATRFLVEEVDDSELDHYVGYAVVGDSDESFEYYQCRGDKECEESVWCEVPQFGPSACGEGGECNGDNGFRGCEVKDISLDEPVSLEFMKYGCADEKEFEVDFENNFANVKLSDERTFTLHEVSFDDEDGTKYANESGLVALWIKDDSAFLEEGGTESYSACRSEVDFY